MKKAVLITTALFLSSMVSCSDKKESSLPQVKTEIYGNSSTESGVQAEGSNDIITLNYAVYGQIESEEYELIKNSMMLTMDMLLLQRTIQRLLEPMRVDKLFTMKINDRLFKLCS